MSFQEELTLSEIEEIIRKMDKMLDSEGFEKVFEWASEKIKEYPNCNMLIWQVAVMLDVRRMMEADAEPAKYDDTINSWYEMALTDEDEEIKHHAAESLFGFYLRKKDYAKAEEYLRYFSNKDPMKMIYQGRLYRERQDKENAYTTFESILFSQYQTLNLTFSAMIAMANEEGDFAKARCLAEKMGSIAGVFEMGSYHEHVSMLDVVCSEKNVEETFCVVEQLLKSVESLYDFQKSSLFQHMKFNQSESSMVGNLKEKLLMCLRDEASFGYMKGYTAWEELLNDQV